MINLSILSILSLCCGAADAGQAVPAGVAIQLPAGESGIGFDDLLFAPALRKILAPGGRSGNLVLVDPDTRALTAIAGFSAQASYADGHGMGNTSADEGRGLLFATDRTTKRLDVVDPKTGTIVAGTALNGGPDYVRYISPTGEVWVTEPSSKRIEIFKLASGPAPTPMSVGFIDIPGGPESLVIDATRRRAYTHLWTDSTLAIDLDKRTIVARWKNGCTDSRGIALDEKRGFLFVGCDEGKATVLDVAHDGKQLGSASTGKGVDVIATSASLGHLYVPSEESQTLTIIGVHASGALTVLATSPTAPGAHCVAADDRGNAYVCAPERGQLLLFKDTLPASR